MLYRDSVLCFFFGFVFLKSVATDPVAVTLQVAVNGTNAKCITDKNEYRVFKGHSMNLHVEYNKVINFFVCNGFGDSSIRRICSNMSSKDCEVQVKKEINRVECKIYFNRDIDIIKPVEKYINHNYTVITCNLKVTVASPLQTSTFKPASQKPITAKTITEKSTIQNPTTQKAILQSPTIRNPTTQKPTIGKPTTRNPATQKSTIGNTTKQQPNIWNRTKQQPMRNSTTQKATQCKTIKQNLQFPIYQPLTNLPPEPAPLVLINNVVLGLRRESGTRLSAEYRYANRVMVQATCVNHQNRYSTVELRMQYKSKQPISDLIDGTTINSKSEVGFNTTFEAVHNGTSMECIFIRNHDGPTITVNVMFVLETPFNSNLDITLSLNGLSYRERINFVKTSGVIEYKTSDKRIQMKCQTNEQYKIDDGLKKYCNGICKVLNSSTEMIEMEFVPKENSSMQCGLNHKTNGSNAYISYVNFTQRNLPNSDCDLRMELTPNNAVIELESSNKEKIIYYVYEHDHELNIKCSGACRTALFYLKIGNDRSEDETFVAKTIHLSQSKAPNITCTLDEKPLPNPTTGTLLLKSITLVFIYNGNKYDDPPLATEALETTTTTHLVADPAPNQPQQVQPGMSMWYILIAAVALIFFICFVSIIVMKLTKRNQRPRGGPYERDYVDLQNEASIPSHPVQWEQSHYAVPADQRTDNDTYAVPYKPQDIYSKPIPKSQRKKENIEPTYAELSLPNVNQFNRTTEADYAEICNPYAKVLPKSQRQNQYADNSDNPEPTYCEPQLLNQNASYANVFDNSGYANAHRAEYVEPTYCETTKRK